MAIFTKHLETDERMEWSDYHFPNNQCVELNDLYHNLAIFLYKGTFRQFNIWDFSGPF